MNVLAKNLQRCIEHKSRLLHFYFNIKKAEKTRSRCKKHRQNVKSNIPNLFDILNNEGLHFKSVSQSENTKM